MTFRGIVMNGQVVVTGLDVLPDGTPVDIEVRGVDTPESNAAWPPDLDLATFFSPEENEDMREGLREVARGEYWADEDAKAALRATFEGAPLPPFTPERKRRERALARPKSRRTKQAPRRSR